MQPAHTDFWWLPRGADQNMLVVGVGHHSPLRDCDDPLQTEWFHSIDDGTFSQAMRWYPLSFLAEWKTACKNTNVYRTMELRDSSGETVWVGPFLIDIDNEAEELEDALNVTRRVIEFLLERWKLSRCDIRVFFSGRKGFNVEVRPSSLRASPATAKEIDAFFRCKLREITSDFGCRDNVVTQRGTVIDPPHDYIRLHGSINCWIGSEGREISRLRLEVGLQDIFLRSASELANQATVLAMSD